MIRKKTASILFLSLMLVLSAVFVYGIWQITLKETEKYFYRSSTFYPIILVSLMLLFIVLALYSDIFGSCKNDKSTINLTNYPRFILVLASAVFIALLWGKLNLFYPACCIGLAVLIYVLNPNQDKIKKLLLSIAIAVIFTLFIYLVFDLLLKINLT